MNAQRVLLGALCALVFGGCHGAGAGPEPPAQVALTLGTAPAGSEAFAALLDGDHVDLEPGSQGGFHFMFDLEIEADAMPAEVTLYREARRLSDGRLLSKAERKHTLEPVDGAPGRWRMKNGSLPFFMCPTPLYVNLIGEEIAVDATLSGLSPDGEDTAFSSVVLSMDCPPEGDPQRDYCERICSGAP